MNPGRRRQPGLGVMLLFYQLFGVIGIDKIPPVTLATIGAQVAIFLRVVRLPWYNPTQVCVSAYNVWKKKEYSRLIYAAFEHGDDWHLYYNMLSFAVKGRSLERRFGSVKFLYILAVFTVLTNTLLVALNIFLSDFDSSYSKQCAVGFSGVIFALKVLTTYYDTNYTQYIMGFPITVPTKYAVWVELVLIQMIHPNVSFVGHLAGILVGFAYVIGPLKFLMDLVYSLGKAVIFPSAYVPSESRFTPRAESSGYRSDGNGYSSRPHNSGYSDYVPSGMSEEEQMRRATEESLRQSRQQNVPPYPDSFSNHGPPPPPGFSFGNHFTAPPAPGFAPDIEELRNRRQAHYT